MSGKPESVRAAVAGIVRHLGTHPEARDTVEGIRRWWLSGQCGETSDADVLAALEQLLQHGRVTRMTLPDGTELFSGPRAEPEQHGRCEAKN